MNESEKAIKRVWATIFVVMMVGVSFVVAIGNMSPNAGASEVVEEVITSDDSDEPLSPVKTTRSVLVETFGGTNCGPCIPVETALDQLAGEYSRSEFSVLDNHIWDAGDEYECPASMARRNYYNNGLFYMPAEAFDGMDWKIGSGNAYTEIKARIDSRLLDPSNITITVTGSLGLTQGTVNAKIAAIDPVSQSSLVTRFIVYEDHNEMDGTHLIRFTVVEDMPEEPILTLVKEQEIDYTKTFNIDPLWDRNKLGVTVFVQSDDKWGPYVYPGGSGDAYYWLAEILQSATLNLSATDQKVDLAIAPSDISFSNPTPNDGDPVTIFATVHNKGTMSSGLNPVMVRFYDGDPGAGGTQIGADQNAGTIMAGGSAPVQVNWGTSGKEGTHEIVVVVDQINMIVELENENNNIAPKTIVVGPPVTTYPYALTYSPMGAGVPVDTDFTVEWNNVMDWDTVNASFSYTDGTSTWDETDGVFSHDPGTKTTVFDPTVDLGMATTYTVTFDTTATNDAGFALDQDQDGTGGEVPDDELNWSFITVTVPPEARALLVDSFAPGTPGILHILNANPTLDWSYYDPEMAAQTDYQVRVGSAPGGNDMWSPSSAGGPGTSEVYAGSALGDCLDYYFGVRVMDDAIWSPWNETMFHTNCIPPAPVAPVIPANDSTVPSGIGKTLTWTSGGVDGDSDAVTYDWELSTDSAFSVVVASSSTASTTSSAFTTTSTTDYYWRVSTYDSYESSPYGNMPLGYWFFKTSMPNDPPEAQSILIDAYLDGTTGILHILTANPTFDWSYYDPESMAQTDYEVRVGSAPGGNDMWAPGAAGMAGLSTVYGGAVLADCNDYYFGVRVADDFQWGLWTETLFHTNCIPPVPTTPISPLDMDTILATGNTIVNWTSGGPEGDGDPVYYDWEVDDTDVSFMTIVAWGSTLSTNSLPFTSDPATTYYWHVRTCDGWLECSAWSPTWQFDAVDDPPTIEAWEPGSGEFIKGDMIDVTWTADDDDVLPPNPIEIEYGSPGNWMPIAANEAHDGIYSWNTSDVSCPGTYKMRLSVTDSRGQTTSDEGNSTFGINCPDTPPIIEAWEPGGLSSGQTYVQGDSIKVTWNASDEVSLPPNSINITYGDGIGPWISIVSYTLNDKEYLWNTQGIPCDQPQPYWMRLSVFDTAGQITYDMSNNSFVLSCPDLSGTIVGTVVDENSEAIENANVTLTNSVGTLIETKQTDSSGAFLFTAVTPGVYTLTAEKPYYETATAEGVNVNAGQQTPVGIILLQTDGIIAGTIIDENGNPVEGATVKMLDENGNVEGIVVTDATGTYEFTGVGYGPCSIQVDASGFTSKTSDQITIDKDNLNEQPFDLTLATPSGQPGQPAGDFIQDYWWLLLIIIAVVIVLIVGLAVMKRRTGTEAVAPPIPPAAPAAPPSAPPAAPAAAAAATTICAGCGGAMEAEFMVCPNCGTPK